MTRKRTRRRVLPLCNPIVMAIEGAAITDTKALDKIRLSELTSLEAFRTGTATKHDWRVCADFLNVQEQLCRTGVGPEALDACLTAQAALGAVQDRSKRLDGRLVLAGPELNALREALEFMDLQRSSISRGRLEEASAKDSGSHSRRASADVKVYVLMQEGTPCEAMTCEMKFQLRPRRKVLSAPKPRVLDQGSAGGSAALNARRRLGSTRRCMG
jgi:hypothetical protein